MSDPRISRRDFLAASVAAPALLALGACSQTPGLEAGEKQLNIFNWADYLHPDAIPEFEKRYGIRVVYDTFASNETLLARMQGGGSRYDIVVPTSYSVRYLAKLGLLKPLDKERLPNFKYIMTRLQNPAYDPGCRYSVPFMWGSTGIGYNRSAFASPAEEPRDWNVFWQSRLARRMTLLDDARETIGMALKRRGFSYNTTEHEPVEQAVSDLVAQKPLTMAYTSDQVIIQLASGDSLASMVYSGDAYQAARSNSNIKYVIPEGGTSIWVDSWCIPKTAPHVDNAYLWINFMLEPEIAGKTANFVGYATPNLPARRFVTPDLIADKNLYPEEPMLEKCEQIGDIGPGTFFFDRMWTELKCS